ncbi:MAG TPA: RagB/SusD family nutrient uptake outer membrane protein, partial [Niabella sp.]
MKHSSICLPLALLLTLSFTACSKMLDVKPKDAWTDETFYTTTYQANLALSGIYSQLSKEALYGYKFNVMLEAGTDETYTNDPGATWAAAKYEYTSSSDEIKNTWLQFYSCIQLVNQLEKNLKADLFSEEEYNQILAKARFMRAFSYFTLANWFGPVPLRLTP